jgi:hypothetical protein
VGRLIEFPRCEACSGTGKNKVRYMDENGNETSRTGETICVICGGSGSYVKKTGRTKTQDEVRQRKAKKQDNDNR